MSWHESWLKLCKYTHWKEIFWLDGTFASYVCDRGISQFRASTVLLVSDLFIDLSMFRSSPVFGIQRSLKMLVISFRTDCSAVMASLCICQDSVWVHSWGHLQTWASSTCLSPRQYHPSWNENLSHRLWDCNSHFTGVRVSFYSFYLDPLEMGWQHHVLGSEACEAALNVTCLGTQCFVTLSMSCV